MDAHLLGFDLLRVVHFDLHLAVHGAPALHGNARHMAGGGKAIGGLAVHVGDDGLHVLLEFIQLPAQSVGDHADGLGKAHVAGHGARGLPLLKFGHLQADTLLLHDGGAEGRQAVHPAGDDVIHALAGAGPQDDQQIHDKAGVDAGAQHGDAVPPGDLVQLGRQLRLLGLGISHLLGGGDDVHAPLHNKHQFVIDITGKGVGAHHHDIGGAGPDDLLGGAHDHVLAVAALNAGHHVIQALAQLGADVDGAHNIHALLFAEHLADAAAHGAQSPENYLHIFHAAFILSVTGRVVQVLCPVCG